MGLELGPWAIPILTSISVFVAACAVVVAYRTLLQTMLPSVAVYAEIDRARPSVINLVIENMGHAPALNVTFESSQPIPCQAFGMGPQDGPVPEPYKTGPLVTGIPVLHPRERRIMTWGQFGGLQHALPDGMLTITARFGYRRPLSLMPGKLSQSSVIHLESFATEDISDRPELRIAKALEKIERQISAIHSALRRQE
jgi:hypothetical protein